MYTVTFYSFKGGVGRTMALSNVAVHLAREGQRVLIVDFDLEAPSFEILRFLSPESSSPKRVPGVVDYVIDYLDSGTVPSAYDYVYEVRGIASDGGRLWVMPAGRNEPAYSARLARIDWKKLYEDHDGYVLFEELKAQWQALYDPDYVLIDSRTGYTDVGGICTRQLPDAVVALFFPNRQNLRGLQHVVEDIRSEGESSRRRAIDLHFVMSNVPDLDDEEEILATRTREFRRALRMSDRPLVINHYDSLAVLTQTVFTRDRPKSRLARQYRRLALAIRQRNPEDVAGALEWISSAMTSLWDSSPANKPADIEHRLEAIRQRHADNGPVLTAIARLRLRQGRVLEARVLLDEALALRHTRASVFLLLADARQRLGDPIGASAAALQVFVRSDASAAELLRAIELLRLVNPQAIGEIGETHAVATLPPDDVIWLSQSLRQSYLELELGWRIVDRSLRGGAGDLDTETKNGLLFEQALSAIGLGRFEEAMKTLNARAIAPNAELPWLFNYAMAAWGMHGGPDAGLFEKLLPLFEQADTRDVSPNFYQCFAVALGVVGRRREASERAETARQLISKRAAPEFTCWRYLQVTPLEFIEDLHLIEAWLRNDSHGPRFTTIPTSQS